jgi:hypothetical protein
VTEMENPDDLLVTIKQHLESIELSRWKKAQRHFRAFGFVKVSFLLPALMKTKIAKEVEELIEQYSVRRELRFAETGSTPRRMRNVRREDINAYGHVVPGIYSSRDILDVLQRVTNEEVHPCPYEPEQFVITELEKSGDTHGWHWDDYSFALVAIIDCPPVEKGGFVQCVPHTQWNKADPQLHRCFVSRPIYSMELLPGDLYLIRADTTLHRVYPISSGRRLIVNMAYASSADLTKEITHETMDNLWTATSPRP